jgi:type IV pilus assembly protein PilM
MQLAQILPGLVPAISVGLDLGQRNVKCVQLSKKGKKIVLDNLFMLDLAHSNEDYPNNSHLVAKLKAAVEVNGFGKPNVTVSGNNRHVQMVDFNLPMMPVKELRLVIERNLQQALNRPVSEITYDFLSLPEGNSQIVRVYYSELEDVIQSIEAVRSVRMMPTEMNASFLATAEMLHFNDYTQADKAYILVDQGERSTRTSLLLGHEVIASNCYPEGLGLINDQFMQAKNISYERAEVLKQQLLELNQVSDESVRAIFDEAYGTVLDSIQKTVDFYLEQELGVPVKEIFLTGGGSVYSSLSQLLSGHYKIPATVVNPFRNIETMNSKYDFDPAFLTQVTPFMASAVGLALGRIEW